MEPRPQQPRQSTGPRNQPPGQTPPNDATSPYPSGPGHDPHGQDYPGGYDPATAVAPPRSDYDYSPLDLAPPDQRRRRQLIAGAIGALSIILVGALVVFVWTVLRDDTPDTDQPDRVANVARTTDDPESQAAATPPATVEPTPKSEEEEPTAPAATEAPTAPPETSVQTDEAGLTALLPDASALPAGFEVLSESSRTLDEVIAALGGSRVAEQSLTTWGWTANVERNFTNPAAAPGTTASLTVSLHGFKDAASATEALPFYSDILVNLGYEELEAPALGDTARLLRIDQEDGGVLIALYVQEGPVLYRFGGYATEGGDPSPDVIDIATLVLGQ